MLQQQSYHVENFRPVRLGYWNVCTYRHKRTNEHALTFTVGAALALETASSAAGQRSTVISVKFVRFHF